MPRAPATTPPRRRGSTGSRSAARRGVERWLSAPSSWVHVELAQQGGIAGIRGDALEERVAAQPLDSRIVVDGPVEPAECLVGIAEIGVSLGNLELRSRRICNKRRERRICIGGAPLRVVAQGQAK